MATKKEIKPITTLTQATNFIYSLEESTRRNLYAVASTLYRVDVLKLYETEDYKSTVDYAEKTFGYKRATSQALIRVASRFLKGNMSKFKNPDEKDYTVYQLMELLPMDDNQITEAIENGELNPYMTTKAIRDLSREYKLTGQKIKKDEKKFVQPETTKNIKTQEQEVAENFKEVVKPDEVIDTPRILNKLNTLYKGITVLEGANKQATLALTSGIMSDVGAFKTNALDTTTDLINSCSEIIDAFKMENVNNESLEKSLVDLLVGLENLKKLF